MMSPPLSLCIVLVLVSVMMHSQAYPMMASYLQEDRHIFHPKDMEDIFESENSLQQHNQLMEDDNLNPDEVGSVGLSMLDFPPAQSMMKRIKGTTLSVVNPLEILRQKLMLEMARRRMHENQKQIDLNDKILEGIGKRSVLP